MFAFELTLAPFTVSVLSSLVIPVLVALVTKSGASSKLKGSLLLVLSSVAGVIATNLDTFGGAVLSQQTIQNAGMAFATSLAMYLGFYKTLGINDKLAPNFGLGSAPDDAVADYRAFPHD